MSLIAGHARFRHTWTQILVVAAVVCLCIVSPVTGLEKETCYSRQHRDVIVALTKPGITMDSRLMASEKDCILSCCSQEVRPGLKCNLVVYKAHKPNDPPSKENCYLFHCATEQDCPLMVSKDVNTYDIFRGYMLPPAKVNPRVTAKPAPATTTTATTTTTSPTTTTTTTAPTTASTTTTTATTTTTTTPNTPTTTTTTTTTTTVPTTTTTEPPTLIIVTMPTEPEPTPATTTTTTTTRPTTTTTVPPDPPALQTTTATTTTTKAPMPPPPPAPHRPVRPPPKRPVRPGPHRTVPHPAKPVPATARIPVEKPIITPTTTTTTTITPTTTTTTTTTTMTTTTIATTTTTTTPATERTTSGFAAMDYELKAELPDAFSSVGPAHGVPAGKAVVSRAAWKTSLVAVVLVGLAFVTMALALVGRKAMESFDRRHYTRLELNDLHYEV